MNKGNGGVRLANRNRTRTMTRISFDLFFLLVISSASNRRDRNLMGEGKKGEWTSNDVGYEKHLVAGQEWGRIREITGG